ncbi:uncharacterized protein PV09_08184 [Verruconis gallopava]|uniref:BTB domain-containing protein n=1 Tax=Verruconis gallopava TaxID=253628 RepID=A0A0D2AMD1_9PEZI|nr:uncharacterized protein PV09_08184 [Verruconis gallopava]KIW00294.1 hypothetical protein PV09_08184 [Verruconis gallopava]
MAATAFAIPNILGPLLLKPAETSTESSERTSKHENGGKAFAKTYKMMKHIRSRMWLKTTENKHISQPILRVQASHASQNNMAQSGTKATPLRMHQSEAIMENANSLEPISSNPITLADNLNPCAGHDCILSSCTHPTEATDALILTHTKSKYMANSKRDQMECPEGTNHPERKACNNFDPLSGRLLKPIPKSTEIAYKSPKSLQCRSNDLPSRLPTTEHSERAWNIASSKNLQPVWIPRPPTDPATSMTPDAVVRPESANSIPDPSTGVAASSVLIGCLQTEVPPLPRKSSLRKRNVQTGDRSVNIRSPFSRSPVRYISHWSNSSSESPHEYSSSFIIQDSILRDEGVNVTNPGSATLPATKATLQGLPQASAAFKVKKNNTRLTEDQYSPLRETDLTASTSPQPTRREQYCRIRSVKNDERQSDASANALFPEVNFANSRKLAHLEHSAMRPQQTSMNLSQIVVPKLPVSDQNYISRKNALHYESQAFQSNLSTPPSPKSMMCTSYPPMKPSCTARDDLLQEKIPIIIGKDFASSQALRVYLPSRMLQQNSKFLSTVIDVTRHVPFSQRKPVRLPDINPIIFRLWLRWIHFHDLQIPDRDEKYHHNREPGIIMLLEAWRLGKMLIDSTFQDACTDNIVRLTNSIYPPDLTHVKTVYDMTNHGSGLRRLFLAMMCEEKLPTAWRRNDQIAIRKVGEAAFADYKTERKENVGG